MESRAQTVVLTGRTGRLLKPDDMATLAGSSAMTTICAADAAASEVAAGLSLGWRQSGLLCRGAVHAAGLQVRFFIALFQTVC